MARTAVLAGATGLVGGELLKQLLASPGYSEVVVLTRKPLGLSDPKLKEHVVDFDKPESLDPLVKGDDCFSSIGTTIARAGNQEAFYTIDFDIPYQLARSASRNGMKQFLNVGSLGADAKSPVFYLRVKGELEQSISALKFEGVHLFRPSLLLGERKEHRRGEGIAQILAPALGFLLLGPLRRYRAIKASDVARAMVSVALSTTPGIHTYESDRVQSVADGGA